MSPLRSIVTLCLSLLSTVAIPAATYFEPDGGVYPEYPPTGALMYRQVQGFEDFPTGFYHAVIPPDYSPAVARPVVIVLHGGPGDADDLMGVWAARFAVRGAIVVFPQCIIDDDPMQLRWNYPQAGAWLLQVLHDVGQTWRIDPRRISLLGHSMGGAGAWALGGVIDSLWASVSPHAGFYTGISVAVPASQLGNVPVFLAHGTADTNVPIGYGADGVWDALVTTGNPFIAYARLVGEDHSGIYNHYLGAGTWLDTCADWTLAFARATDAAAGPAIAELGAYSVAKGFGWSYTNTPIGRPIGYPNTTTRPYWTADAALSAASVEVGEGVRFTADGDDNDRCGSESKRQPVFLRWRSTHDGDAHVDAVFWGRNTVRTFDRPGTYTVTAIPMDCSGNVPVDGGGSPDFQVLTLTVVAAGTAPVVTVTAIDAAASESDGNHGLIRVTRTGSTAATLPLTVTAGGSVSLTADLPASFVDAVADLAIPAGADHIDVVVSPVADGKAEGIEIVGVDLHPGVGYIVGPDAAARVYITDESTPLRRVGIRVAAGGDGVPIDATMTPDLGDPAVEPDETRRFPIYPASLTVAVDFATPPAIDG